MRIWRLLLILGLGVSLAACSTSQFGGLFGTTQKAVSRSNINTSVLFNNLSGYWKFSQTVNVAGVQIDTFIPQDESKYRWTERIAITHTSVSPKMTVSKYYRQVIKPDYNEQCYAGRDIRVLHHNHNFLMYQYAMHECGKMANQFVVGKIMRGANSISAIAYANKRKGLTEEQRQNMVHLVSTATLVQ